MPILPHVHEWDIISIEQEGVTSRCVTIRTDAQVDKKYDRQINKMADISCSTHTTMARRAHTTHAIHHRIHYDCNIL